MQIKTSTMLILSNKVSLPLLQHSSFFESIYIVFIIVVSGRPSTREAGWLGVQAANKYFGWGRIKKKIDNHCFTKY